MRQRPILVVVSAWPKVAQIYGHIVMATPEKHIRGILTSNRRYFAVTQIGYSHASMTSYLTWSIPVTCRATGPRIWRSLSYVTQRERTCSGPGKITDSGGWRLTAWKPLFIAVVITQTGLVSWRFVQRIISLVRRFDQLLETDLFFPPSHSKRRYTPLWFSLFRSLQSYRYAF